MADPRSPTRVEAKPGFPGLVDLRVRGLLASSQAWRLTAPAALLAVSACAYVDPGCILPGQGSSPRRHGSLLHLAFRLPESSFESFDVSQDGGATYTSHQATLCQRMDTEQFHAVLQAWSSPALQTYAEGECGPGWSFGRVGSEEPCPGARQRSLERRWSSGPYMIVDVHIDGGPLTLFWDLEGALPIELEAPMANTLGVVCAESRALKRSVRRRAPALAAMAGC